MKLINLTLALLISSSLYGESNTTSSDTKVSKSTKATTPKGIFYGKILEIKDAMGYKYLKVDENGKTLWVAIANAPVKIGEKIGYDKKTVMKNFKSKTLKREFKEVIFASEVYLASKPKPIKTMKDMLGLSKKDPHKGMGIGKSPKKDEKPAKPFVKKDTYTISEIHMWRKSLAGQTLNIEGKVFKVSRGIMKLDWVHLGDGTGNEKKLTDDLVFTASKTDVKAGDMVKGRGKVVVDKDFGYGYFYRVIIQDASFTKK